MFCIFWCTTDGNRNLTLTTHILETHAYFVCIHGEGVYNACIPEDCISLSI